MSSCHKVCYIHTAIRCNTLQHTTTHYNTLQHTASYCNTLEHGAIQIQKPFSRLHVKLSQGMIQAYCNTLQQIATRWNMVQYRYRSHCLACTSSCHKVWYIHTATHCITLQHAATNCNTDTETISQSAYQDVTRYDINILQHAEARCNTLQHAATHCNAGSEAIVSPARQVVTRYDIYILQHTATKCNTRQHTATHCNTLQHTATHCNTDTEAIVSPARQVVTRYDTGKLQHAATHCDTLQRTATRCNTLQHRYRSHCLACTSSCHKVLYIHTATHCNTLQHAATHCNTDTETIVQSAHQVVIRYNIYTVTAGLHIVRTNADSQWYPVYKVFHGMPFGGKSQLLGSKIWWIKIWSSRCKPAANARVRLRERKVER